MNTLDRSESSNILKIYYLHQVFIYNEEGKRKSGNHMEL